MTLSDREERTSSADADRRRLAAVLLARRSAPAPLAPNQERLLVLQQLDPASTAYTEAVVLRLSGPVDHEALVAAVRSLPQRHEWLRSRVEDGPDGPLQVLDSTLGAPVDVVDLTGVGAPVPPDEPGEPGATWLAGVLGRPFDLRTWPAWRAGLATLDRDEHLLVLAVHHVACDATSLGVLVEELGARYDAAVTGQTYDGGRTPSPRDLARTVRELQSSPAATAATERHVQALAAADLDARWPDRGDAGGTGAATASRHVPAPVARRVRRLAADHDLTPFSLVSAAVAAGLADRLQVASPVLGVPVDLRTHLPGSDEVVAFLVETVAVAAPAVRERSLLEQARAVRDTVTDGLVQPPRFDDVVTALRARGALPVTGTPVQAYVTWLDGQEQPTLGEHGPRVHHVDLPSRDAKFDLALTAVERGRSLDLRLEYDSGRLARSDAEDLLDRVVSVLDVGSSSPSTPLGRLELLGAAELGQLVAWEGVAAPAPQVDLLDHVLAGLATTGPVLLTDRETVTGEALLGLVDGLAAALVAAGVGPGTRVAVPAHRVPGLVVALLAVLRAGGTYLPLDPSHPPTRERELARAARVGAVVGDGAWAGPLAADLAVPAVATDRLGRPVVAPAGPSGRAPGRLARGPHDLAYVMFTSGSTGRPKAVRVHDGAVVARVESYRQDLAASGVRFLLQSTLTFDASTFLFWVLATGGTLVLADDAQAADPAALAGLTARHDVTDVFYVPAMYEAVLDVAAPVDLSGLRRVLVGGDVMPPALAVLHHEVVPGAVLHNVYGPTEVVVSAVSTPVSAADGSRGTVPIGRPHPGTVARVLDPFGRRVPLGAVGELHLGGPAVADGYDDPGTGARMASPPGPFRPVPDGTDGTDGTDTDGTVPGYATGDLVRWGEDGRLEYVGRQDRQVKLRGQRVELDEVEAAVLALPGVTEAAVELVGTGATRRLLAAVSPEPVAAGVRTALTAVLPEAWLPDLVVALPALPRTGAGKLDRAALRAAVGDAPDPTSAPGRRTGRATDPARDHAPGPGSLVERTVLSVVQGLLGAVDLTLDDDFFAAGGNSLLAARLIGQLHTVLGVTVPLHELAGGSSVRAIAALAQDAAGRGAATPQDTFRLVPVRRTGTRAPVVLVARDGATSLVLLHVLSRLDPQRPVWTLLRAMPAPGLAAPDLVTDGRSAAAVVSAHLPDGPVHVVGHSASGLVALETARALGGRAGRTVLLDTVPPATWATPLRRLVDAARVVVRAAKMRRVLGRVGAAGLSADDVRSLRTYQDTAASHRTRVRPLDRPVTLLTSAEARDGQGRDDLGWGDRLADLTTVPLPGDHHQLLLQPDVRDTARLLVEVLRG